MLGRYQIEERLPFTSGDKFRMLEKSKHRCAHCGKALRVSTMTVEHFIPISKAGTNNFENLVALCEECNVAKTNFIIDPEEYYKYLTSEYKKELKNLFKKYCDEVGYLSGNNFFKTDVFTIKSKIAVPMRDGRLHYSKRNAVFEKAKITDFDEILDYVVKYHNHYNIEVNMSGLRDFIYRMFRFGSILYTRSSSGEFLIVFFISAFPTVICSGEEPVKIGNKLLLNYDLSCYMIINPNVETTSSYLSYSHKGAVSEYLFNVISSFLASIGYHLNAEKCSFGINLICGSDDKRLGDFIVSDHSIPAYKVKEMIIDRGDGFSYATVHSATKDIHDKFDTGELKPMFIANEELFCYSSNASKFLHDRVLESNLYEEFCEDIYNEFEATGFLFKHDFSYNDWVSLLNSLEEKEKEGQSHEG